MSRAMTMGTTIAQPARKTTASPAARAARPETLDRGHAHEQHEHHRQDPDGPAADVVRCGRRVRAGLASRGDDRARPAHVRGPTPMGVRHEGACSHRDQSTGPLRPIGTEDGRACIDLRSGPPPGACIDHSSHGHRRTPPSRGGARRRGVAVRAAPVLRRAGPRGLVPGQRLADERERRRRTPGTTNTNFTFSRHLPGQRRRDAGLDPRLLRRRRTRDG